MGVHDVDHYGSIKKLLEIPAEEPIFILRAQDRISTEVIDYYRRTYTHRKLIAHEIPDEQFVADLDESVSGFIDWQQQHSDDVKFPD